MKAQSKNEDGKVDRKEQEPERARNRKETVGGQKNEAGVSSPHAGFAAHNLWEIMRDMRAYPIERILIGWLCMSIQNSLQNATFQPLQLVLSGPMSGLTYERFAVIRSCKIFDKPLKKFSLKWQLVARSEAWYFFEFAPERSQPPVLKPVRFPRAGALVLALRFKHVRCTAKFEG